MKYKNYRIYFSFIDYKNEKKIVYILITDIIINYLSQIKKMYRFSFNRIELLKQNTTLQLFIQVETQNNNKYRTGTKKVKNNIAKFYGDFIDLQKQYFQFIFRIIQITPNKTFILRQKINLGQNIIEANKKKSHTIQTQKIRLIFESEIIYNNESINQQTLNDFSNMQNKQYLPNRVNDLKRSRQLSTGSRDKQRRTLSKQWERKISSKSFTKYQQLKKQNILYQPNQIRQSKQRLTIRNSNKLL